MITNPSLHASTLPSALSSSLITLHGSSVKCMPCLPFRALRKINWIRATSAADGGPIESSPALGSKNPLAVVLDIPRTIWKKTMRPLSDFGFGGRSIWEGGVGLFLVSGAVLFALSLAWLKGFQMRSKFRKYTATFEFDQACGICTGTPVRIRGVTVGDVIRVNPSLRSIEAIVEVPLNNIIFWMNMEPCLTFCTLTSQCIKILLGFELILVGVLYQFKPLVSSICRLKTIKQSYREIHWLK